MDKSAIKEILEYFKNITHYPISDYIGRFVGIEDMSTIRRFKINLEQRSYIVSSTLLYTIVLQFITMLLLVLAEGFYNLISNFTQATLTYVIMKITAMLLFTCGYIGIATRQYDLFGTRTGESIIKSGKTNLPKLVYVYLFINTILSYIISIIALFLVLFKPDMLSNISYFGDFSLDMIGILLSIDVINAALYIIFKLLNRKFTISVTNTDIIKIFFKDGTPVSEHNLCRGFYLNSFFRIKIDNNISIYHLNNGNCDFYDHTAIEKITIGPTTLKYNTKHNKWKIQPPTPILTGSDN